MNILDISGADGRLKGLILKVWDDERVVRIILKRLYDGAEYKEWPWEQMQTTRLLEDLGLEGKNRRYLGQDTRLILTRVRSERNKGDQQRSDDKEVECKQIDFQRQSKRIDRMKPGLAFDIFEGFATYLMVLKSLLIPE